MTDSYYSGEPLRIGTGTQLLIDDALVEDRWRLTRELAKPEKFVRNPVLICDKPWEGGVIPAFTFFRDPSTGKLRAWYSAYLPFGEPAPGMGRAFVCHAESEDGLNWTKPLFQRFPVGRSAETNIVYAGTYREDPRRYGVSVSQVWRDDEDPDASRRYKMICYESRPDGGTYRRGVNLAVSPDGYEWRLDGDRHILDYNSDFTNHVVWDPAAKQWLLYCRPRCTHATGLQPQEMSTEKFPEGRHSSRRLAVMTSPDFKTWSYPRTCFYPDEGDATDYDALGVFRNGSHFIMFYVAMAGDEDATKDLRLASSRDGIHWTPFHTREPIIARGRPGDWDAGQIMRVPVNGPLVEDGRMMMFYSGSTKGQFEWHGQGNVGVAFAKPDRFVMQTAGDEPGYLITKEFVLEGNRLRLNCYYPKRKDCLHSLKVEIIRHPSLGGHGGFRAPYEGFSFADCETVKENSTEALVKWKGGADLSALQGKPVYLRFQMRNMSLFSFRTPIE